MSTVSRRDSPTYTNSPAKLFPNLSILINFMGLSIIPKDPLNSGTTLRTRLSQLSSSKRFISLIKTLSSWSLKSTWNGKISTLHKILTHYQKSTKTKTQAESLSHNWELKTQSLAKTAANSKVDNPSSENNCSLSNKDYILSHIQQKSSQNRSKYPNFQNSQTYLNRSKYLKENTIC